jgi:5-methylcytosine-specific restriction endonuclease McrA
MGKARRAEKHRLTTYLRSDKWLKMKEQVINRDGNRCTECGTTENLEAHHLHYDNLWNEDGSESVTLCKACHSNKHPKKNREQCQQPTT